MAISDARHRANEKYNAKAYDEIKVRVAKGRKAELQAFVERHGLSVNGFINSLIDEALERERAGAVPAGSPAAEDGPGVDMVSAGGSPGDNVCSRLTSLAPPDFSAGQPDNEPEFLRVARELAAMSPDERDRALGCDPESMERRRPEDECKRQRLAELNAKRATGGLSRAEDAEWRRLMVACKSYPTDGDSAQE